MNFKYIPSDKIEKNKWNSCVHYASNGNIFGYKWFLDNTTEEWTGLVQGDYESVLPLTFKTVGFFRKKLELRASYYAKEQGIYSINVLSKSRANSFFKELKKYWSKSSSIHLSGGHTFQNLNSFFNEIILKPQSNLLLLASYEKIKERYSSNITSIIKENFNKNLTSLTNIKPEFFAKFIVNNNQYFSGKDKDIHLYTILRVVYNVLHRGWGFLSGIANKQGVVLANAFFVIDGSKAILLYGACSPEGKEKAVIVTLLNQFIQSNAGRPLVLDLNDTFFPELKKYSSGFRTESFDSYLVSSIR